ncbi:MAG: hypothetical protein LUG90_10755 [Clostridiaceae bacterium]|nr:hypothetical protein [Clostridiaceae bacterium]
MSKNTFGIIGDVITITRPEWHFVAQATVRKDYLEEIQSVTWVLNNNRYLYCRKLGTLHSYVMKKWYGEELCQEMNNNGYVIDHMDNESYNCCINNLCFLHNADNKAKGFTLDQKSKDKSFIALTMYKDFSADRFQITIVFNYPATLKLTGFDHSSVIDLAYLLYECNYPKVIADAQNILLDYKDNYTFEPEKLRAVDYHIEGYVGEAVPPEVYEEYLSKRHGHGVAYFEHKSMIDWTTSKKEFIIEDRTNGGTYQIKL